MKRFELVLAFATVFAAVTAACSSDEVRPPGAYAGDASDLPGTGGTDPGSVGGPRGPGVDPYVPEKPSSEVRDLLCPKARAADAIPQREATLARREVSTFDALKAEVVTACGGCHQSPAMSGGFRFRASYESGDEVIDGVKVNVLGLSAVAETITAAVRNGIMPPTELRSASPERFKALGEKLKAWVDAGKPAGTFELPLAPGATEGGVLSPEIGENMTSLGDCIPAPELAGIDAAKDDAFAAMTALPSKLADTDLVSLDAYELARRGTFAYEPAYPLWTDDAKKQRWVHVPSVARGGGRARQPIVYNPQTKTFDIPENTRFYKTFFREVKEASGKVRYRKVETRLIVVRKPWDKALFGTYLWNAAETEAMLITTPYRSGEPFKDTLLTLEVDEVTHKTRGYGVPAKHRCIECHQGSDSDAFVLGFSPMQIHLRPGGEGAQRADLLEDQLSQVDRLTAYGVVTGFDTAQRPKLELAGASNAPRNVYELRAQAYVLGNCAHCHNPKGFAVRQDGKLVNLNFGPGKLFQFPVGTAGVSSTKPLVSALDPLASVIYTRVANDTEISGATALQHMPLHTPATDCNAVDTIGRWVVGIPRYPNNASAEDKKRADEEAEQRVRAFDPKCTPAADITWVEEDFTETAVYQPRRADWNGPAGMPASFRELSFTEKLRALAAMPIANGYFNKKRECQFPTVAEPPGGTRPWMLDRSGAPKRPYGEVFYQTAGATYFAEACQKCHGPRANGDSGIAKLIAKQTGGALRVANLRDGLFGSGGANLRLFDVVDETGPRNLAGNYLIWMSSGGTRVRFPDGLTELVGPYGANMLNRIRAQFRSLLPNAKNPLRSTFQNYEMYAAVATLDNPIPEDAGFDAEGKAVNPAVQEAWLDRAQSNAGWMLFRFFEDEVQKGKWPLTPNECEKVYPAPSTAPAP